MKMGPTLIIQSCDGEHNPYFIGMMDLFVDWRTSLQMSPGSLSGSGSPCNTRIISVSTTAASACLLTRAQPKLRNVKTNLHLNLKSWNQNKLAKPRSYASLKLRLTDSLTHLLTGVKCRATSVAKKVTSKDAWWIPNLQKLRVFLSSIFSYASSSTLYPCQ